MCNFSWPFKKIKWKYAYQEKKKKGKKFRFGKEHNTLIELDLSIKKSV